MSSRALRKAQREREEHERLSHLQAEDEDAGDTSNDVHVPIPHKSPFALLEDEQYEIDQPERDEDELEQDDIAVSEPRSKPSSKKKKQKKRSKEKSKGNKTNLPESDNAEVDDQLDEIDVALKQLSAQGGSSQSDNITAGLDPERGQANKLLAIDTVHLHAQNEMRRLFGRAALEEQDEEQQAAPGPVGGNRRQQRRVRQVGLAQALRGQRQGGRPGAFSAMALRRNMFIQGKEEWPSATTGGLSMDIEERRADGTTLYRFVHNSAYQSVQAQFESCVESMDPNRLVVLLQHNPYHISTLLQVSEIAKQERDHATSGDLLERALFSFGRAVHSTFSKNLSEGKARLDFRRSENREFWLASWRYMQNLSMRATWRTVYEWAKLLLSLSPESDPYAIWLVLDQYALRSRQGLDFLNISSNPILQKAYHSLPNVQLSQGLAEFRAGNSSKGKQALYTAITRYPWIIARLFQELSLDPPPAIWGKEPRSEKEKLYCELYVTRAKDLWSAPEVSDLLLEIASAVPSGAETAPIDGANIRQNEARHVLLSDTPSLIALVPREYTAQLTSAADPMPPDDAFLSYLQRRHGTTNPTEGLPSESSRSELLALQRYLAHRFPWFGHGEPTVTDNTAADDNPTHGTDEESNMLDEEIRHRLQDQSIDESERAELIMRLALSEIQHGRLDPAILSDPAAVQRLIGEQHNLSNPETESHAETVLANTRHATVEDASDEDQSE